MNRILKRIVSTITTFSLCASMIGAMPVIADDYTATSTVTRTLSVDFMGRGDEPQETSPGKARLTSADKGSEFWIGVAVDNVDNLPLFENGIYSLEIAFEYDPKIVEPYFTSNKAEEEWAAELVKGNFGAANDSLWWKNTEEEEYEIISVTETDINTTTDRENADIMADRVEKGWRMCTVCVTFKNGTASAGDLRFEGLEDASKQYLLKLPFKLNAVPDEIDTYSDPNPTVLSLVRGPETFNIGSGYTGTDPFSAWEATVDNPDDAENMKTLFTFAGDISLFDAGAVIEGIVPVKLKTGDETEDTPYTLSSTKELNLDGFKPDTSEYYLSVPNETEKIMLKIKSSDLPTVVANSTSLPPPTLASDKLYETAEFALLELNKNVDKGGEADGYNNTVTVEAGGVTYTLHIRRLLKPQIVFNPGNSPYGLIERMGVEYLGETDGWSDDKIEQAKTGFDLSHTTNKTYKTGFVPNNAQTTVNYTTSAWENSDKNYDMVEEAVFVYEGKAFTDPGYKIYDEFGELVSNPSVQKNLSVRIISPGVPKYTTNEGSMTDVAETDGKFSLSGKIIRPDVYSLVYTYTYTDASTAQQKSMSRTRPVIILSQRGDITLTASPLVNSNDATLLKNNWSTLKAKSVLFAFRVADLQITTTPLLNSNDATHLKNNWSKGYVQFYSVLD